MTIDRAVMALAGCFILLGIILSVTVNQAWLWLSAIVGLNLIQASFTGFCPAAMILKALGVRSGATFK